MCQLLTYDTISDPLPHIGLEGSKKNHVENPALDNDTKNYYKKHHR